MLKLNTKNQPISEERPRAIQVQQSKQQLLFKHSLRGAITYKSDQIPGLYFTESYDRIFLLIVPLPKDHVIELLREDDQIEAAYKNISKDALLITVRVNPPAPSYTSAQDCMIEYFEKKYQVWNNL